MSEILAEAALEPGINQELVDEPSDVFLYVDSATSVERFTEVAQGAQSLIQSDPALKLLYSENQRISELNRLIRESSDINKVQTYTVQLNELIDSQKQDPETKSRFNQLNRVISNIEHLHTRELYSGDEEAGTLMALLKAADTQRDTTAPFSKFEENDKESWSWVPNEAIDEYLSEKLFFKASDKIKQGDKNRNKIAVDAEAGENIEVPLSVIVSVAGFDSWKGRTGEGSEKKVSGEYASNYNGPLDSHDLVKHYASLPTELPAVNEVRLFVQPNGIIFGDNVNGDSHRVAAAILRGDKTIKAKRVVFQTVKDNYLDYKKSA
jgi:hypothetical protein